MLTSRVAAVALAMTAFLPLAASAADLPPAYKSPVVAPAYSLWAGWYVGLNAGYAWGSSSINYTGDPAVLASLAGFGVPASSATSPKGFLGGIQAGYNWQSGKLVYGLEADIDYATIKGAAVSTVVTSGEQKLDMFGTLRGRLGYAMWDTLLLYGTGGLAMGHGKMDNTFGAFTSSSSKWMVGWTLGAGVEYMLTSRWSAKAEYLYYSLGTQTYTFAVGGGASATAEAAHKGSIARVGLNYRF